MGGIDISKYYPLVEKLREAANGDKDSLYEQAAFAIEGLDETVGAYAETLYDYEHSDLVKVVRCKDCQHYKGGTNCAIIDYCGGLNFFCYCGKRPSA